MGTEAPGFGADIEIGSLRGEIVNFGSSWAALCLAIKIRPLELAELLREVGYGGIKGTKARERVFNACADGYGIFADARLRRKL